MSNVDEFYHYTLGELAEYGRMKPAQRGVSTLSMTGGGYTVCLNGFKPALMVSKALPTDKIDAETRWFLSGDTDLDTLIANGVGYWNQWCLPGTAKYDDEGKLIGGSLGRIYQAQWRHWRYVDTVHTWEEVLQRRRDGYPAPRQWWNHDTNRWSYDYDLEIDQLANALDLLRNDPNSRRILVLAWNPAELDQMALPPCHYVFQFTTDVMEPEEAIEHKAALQHWGEKATAEGVLDTDYIQQRLQQPRVVNLVLTMRSNDLGLGHPFNLYQYSEILNRAAWACGYIPGTISWHGADVHLYTNQLEPYQQHLQQYTDNRDYVDAVSKGIYYEFGSRVAGVLLEPQKDDLTVMGYNPLPAVKYPLAAL